MNTAGRQQQGQNRQAQDQLRALVRLLARQAALECVTSALTNATGTEADNAPEQHAYTNGPHD